VEKMLDALEKRIGKKPGATVIVDRGPRWPPQNRPCVATSKPAI